MSDGAEIAKWLINGDPPLFAHVNYLAISALSLVLKFISRRRTNVQQLTCNIGLSSSFYYLFFSFVLIELEPFVLNGKVLGEKFWKSVTNYEKSVTNYETILPFSCCPFWPSQSPTRVPVDFFGSKFSLGRFEALSSAKATLITSVFPIQR